MRLAKLTHSWQIRLAEASSQATTASEPRPQQPEQALQSQHPQQPRQPFQPIPQPKFPTAHQWRREQPPAGQTVPGLPFLNRPSHANQPANANQPIQPNYQVNNPIPAPPHAPPQTPEPEPIPDQPQEPSIPWWRNEKQIIRIIAIFGGLITAAGVAFLVAVAIQSGLIGPIGRVVLAYLLAAGLGVAAVRAHRRQAPAAGVTALIATSLAAAHLTTMSMSFLLDWMPTATTLILMLPFATIGLYGARWTRSSVTAIWALVINTVLMGWTLIGFDFARQTITAPLAQLVLPLMTIIATFLFWKRGFRKDVVVYLALATTIIGAITITNSLVSPIIAAFTIALFVGTQFGPLALAQQLAVTLDDESSDPESPEDFAFIMAVSLAVVTPMVLAIPGAVAVASTSRLVLLLFAGVVFFAAIAAVYFWDRSVFRYVAPAGLATAVIPWLTLAIAGSATAAAKGTTSQLWALIPLTVGATVFLWTLAQAPGKSRGLELLQVPEPTRENLVAYVKAASLTWLVSANLVLAYMFKAAVDANAAKEFTASWAEIVAVAFLLLADVGLAMAAANSKVAPPFALVGLTILGMPFIVLLTSAGVSFNVAHMLLSIFWMTIAGMLVLSKRFLHIPARLTAGLTIAALSIVKLVFYDMATLDGYIRAIAFLVCGLILLAMAVSGAKQKNAEPVSESAPAPVPAPTPASAQEDSGRPDGNSPGDGPDDLLK